MLIDRRNWPAHRPWAFFVLAVFLAASCWYILVSAGSERWPGGSSLPGFTFGVAGGLFAGSLQFLYSIQFTTQDSIILLAVVMMGGVFSLWGAVVAAVLLELLPAWLNNLGVASDWLTILFGVGVLQVLTTAPAGIVDQLPRDIRRLAGLIMKLFRRLFRRPAPTPGGASLSRSPTSPCGSVA